VTGYPPSWQIDRRAVLGAVGTAGAAGVALLACAGCDGGSAAQRPVTTGSPAHPEPTASASAAAADRRLRDRAIADERRLLGACAAPAGAEPFATLRATHRAHLRVLTGQSAADVPPAARPPQPQLLAQAEREAALARGADCSSASTTLAPLLASLAASGSVAAALLVP
jgi:hypothetical protein